MYLFCRVMGFTWDSMAWIFSSNSLIFSSFFWDSAWASCRALNSSSNCRDTDRKRLYVDITDACKHTCCLQKMATGRINRHRNTLPSALWVIPIHICHGPQALLSSAFVSGLAFVTDLTFTEAKPCRYDDFSSPAWCTVSQGDRNLKKKTYPGPPTGGAVRQLRLDLDRIDLDRIIISNLMNI